MSSDKLPPRTPIQRIALAIVRADMRSYDVLSRSPRYRVELPHQYDTVVDLAYGTRSCAHDRALHDVCVECERSEEDCKAYRVAATQRIKELLKQLGE